MGFGWKSVFMVKVVQLYGRLEPNLDENFNTFLARNITNASRVSPIANYSAVYLKIYSIQQNGPNPTFENFYNVSFS